MTSEPRRTSSDPPAVGRSDEHVGRSAVSCDLANCRDDVVRLLLEEVRPENDPEPAKRGERFPFGLGELGVGAANPQDVDLCPEALGRAPGSAHEPLRALLRRHEREDALGERALAIRVEHGRVAASLDVLGDLTQRELTQRREPVDVGRSS